MENIILYDKQANPVITFSDFNVLDDANQFISTAITISYNIFHLNTSIDIERADLEGLASSLRKIYNRKCSKCYFQPIEKLLDIEMQYLECGSICVNVVVRDSSYTGELRLSFQTDQTFIPPLIDEIERVLNMPKI